MPVARKSHAKVVIATGLSVAGVAFAGAGAAQTSSKTFIDYLKPTPITCSPLTSATWGVAGVLPRDVCNGLESAKGAGVPPEYYYWDGKIIRANDGTYHLFASRWLGSAGFNPGWLGSDPIHAVSDGGVLGPFSDLGYAYSNGPDGANPHHGHNTSAVQLQDGTYGLVVSEVVPFTVFSSSSLDGPWTPCPSTTGDRIQTTGVNAGTDTHWDSNVSLIARPDGKFEIVQRHGLIGTSNTLCGPYQLQTPTNTYPSNEQPTIASIYPNRTKHASTDPQAPATVESTYSLAEDPVIWFSGGKYHVLYDYPDDRVGYHLTSQDGIHNWTDEGLAYDPRLAQQIFGYAGSTTVNQWYKMERPGVLIENGHVTHVTWAVSDVDKNNQIPAGSNHGSKVVVVTFDGVLFDYETGDGGAPDAAVQDASGVADGGPPQLDAGRDAGVADATTGSSSGSTASSATGSGVAGSSATGSASGAASTGPGSSSTGPTGSGGSSVASGSAGSLGTGSSGAGNGGGGSRLGCGCIAAGGGGDMGSAHRLVAAFAAALLFGVRRRRLRREGCGGRPSSLATLTLGSLFAFAGCGSDGGGGAATPGGSNSSNQTSAAGGSTSSWGTLTSGSGMSTAGGGSTPSGSSASSGATSSGTVTSSGSATSTSMSAGSSSGPHDAGADGGPGSDAGDSGQSSGVLGATPPMGWNSWNTFGCGISESLIKATADAMVSSGMQATGYQYVNLDDCWMNGRDSSGNIQWNATKFPSGIPALAQYVHGKGLKIGLYSTPNTKTCSGIYSNTAGAVGSLGYETQDAKSYASWGIDYLKYDHCTGSYPSFTTMRDALRATGRPIFYSINPGDGSGCPPTGPTTSTCGLDLPAVANMWRIGFDINASWSSITGLVDQDAPLSPYAGPGHWNDPDMLEVGNGSLSTDENKSHFSMWAILAAPLIAGNDIRSMSQATKTTLTNTDVIAVDQDPLGQQGTLVATPQSGLQVWSKTLSGTNARAVALLNRNGSPASITVSFTQVGLSNAQASVRDLWQQVDLGMSNGSYTATNVPSHGVVMLRITQ